MNTRGNTTQRGYGHAWQQLRLAILDRDHWTCRYCRKPISGFNATVDHILAKRYGGTDAPSNLAACCRACQNRKGDQQGRSRPPRRLRSRIW